MELAWKPSALKEMKALPKSKQDAVIKAVLAFAADPFGGHPNATPLKGEKNTVRLRIGDWRVIVYLGKDVVEVRAVGHRREVYR